MFIYLCSRLSSASGNSDGPLDLSRPDSVLVSSDPKQDHNYSSVALQRCSSRSSSSSLSSLDEGGFNGRQSRRAGSEGFHSDEDSDLWEERGLQETSRHPPAIKWPVNKRPRREVKPELDEELKEAAGSLLHLAGIRSCTEGSKHTVKSTKFTRKWSCVFSSQTPDPVNPDLWPLILFPSVPPSPHLIVHWPFQAVSFVLGCPCPTKTNGNSIAHTGEQSHIETFVTSGASGRWRDPSKTTCLLLLDLEDCESSFLWKTGGKGETAESFWTSRIACFLLKPVSSSKLNLFMTQMSACLYQTDSNLLQFRLSLFFFFLFYGGKKKGHCFKGPAEAEIPLRRSSCERGAKMTFWFSRLEYAPHTLTQSEWACVITVLCLVHPVPGRGSGLVTCWNSIPLPLPNLVASFAQLCSQKKKERKKKKSTSHPADPV